MKPDVSIIVPIYNTSEYLVKCLDSILNQTNYNIEVICINDGSTDDSLEILEDYQKKDRRIKVISQLNKGLSEARNVGVVNSTSDYLMFIDSDDYINDNMVESLYKKALEDSSDIVISRFQYVSEDSTSIISISPAINSSLNKHDLFKQFLAFEITPCVTVCLYRKELFSANNLKFKQGIYYEDLELQYKLIFHAKKISIINSAFYNYFIRNDSITSLIKEKNILDAFIVFDESINFVKSINKFNFYKEDLVKRMYTLLKVIITTLIKKRDDSLIKLIWNNIKVVEGKLQLTEIQKIHLYFLTLQATKNKFLFKEEVVSSRLIKKLKKYINHELGIAASIIDFLEVNQQIKNIYIYGGGDILISMLPYLSKLNINILGVVDRNSLSINYKGNKYYSKKFNEVKLKNYDYILISSVASLEAITEEVKLYTEKNRIKVNIIGWNNCLQE